MIHSFSRLVPILSSRLFRYDGCRTSCYRFYNRHHEFSSFSRMIDMGGMPSAGSDRSAIRTANASKNSKVQVVAFDFKLLINADKDGRNNKDAVAPVGVALENEKSIITPNNNTSDNDKIQQSKLSLTSIQNQNDHNPSHQDIRAKYAHKLKKSGGLAALELAKSHVKDTLASGDASGHLATRKIAIKQGHNTSNNQDMGGTNTKWLPSLEASTLLTYLTHRTICIVLLPTIIKHSSEDEEGKVINMQQESTKMMHDFAAQLKNVIIDNIIPTLDGGDRNKNNNKDNDNNRIKNTMKNGILNKYNMDPNRVLLVSDREEYLRVARDMGMIVCRLQKKNTRRGNITPHYSVENVEEVQEVVNEINGISFNTILNR
mmetsp:Transcript_11053/g.11850  ORF Transcript_11053/g.11850 Transcript_11053/m.11850 type:complete len:374 (-) Transcript_11053:60-1181(-)